MKCGPLPIFLILALYFIHEVNAGKIVGKLESANTPMDKELVAKKANSKYLTRGLRIGRPVGRCRVGLVGSGKGLVWSVLAKKKRSADLGRPDLRYGSQQTEPENNVSF